MESADPTAALHIQFATARVGFALDSLALWRNGSGAAPGSRWQRLPWPRLPRGRYFEADSFLHGLAVTGHTVAFAGGEYGPLGPGCQRHFSHSVRTSHDDGRTWITAPLPTNSYVLDIRYLNDRLGVLIAYTMTGKCKSDGLTNALYVTRDGGRHFTRVLSCAAKARQLCTAARFASPRMLLAGRNDGTTVISTDGGRHWSREPSCDSASVYGFGEVAAFDATRAIAGGPTCIAARVNTPVEAPAALLPNPGGAQGPASTASAGGRTISVLPDGGLVITPPHGFDSQAVKQRSAETPPQAVAGCHLGAAQAEHHLRAACFLPGRRRIQLCRR